ncbi:hypothetical protein ACP6C7_20885 [Mycolicibacterium septicum]|uniref:Uncharacterized protein n=1 Tax=Mycolicibacterium septicum TaxID=98668 RepID=A0ABW9LT26_9MYCO
MTRNELGLKMIHLTTTIRQMQHALVPLAVRQAKGYPLFDI